MSNQVEDCFKFWGLLRKAELYIILLNLLFTYIKNPQPMVKAPKTRLFRCLLLRLIFAIQNLLRSKGIVKFPSYLLSWIRTINNESLGIKVNSKISINLCLSLKPITYFSFFRLPLFLVLFVCLLFPMPKASRLKVSTLTTYPQQKTVRF